LLNSNHSDVYEHIPSHAEIFKNIKNLKQKSFRETRGEKVFCVNLRFFNTTGRFGGGGLGPETEEVRLPVDTDPVRLPVDPERLPVDPVLLPISGLAAAGGGLGFAAGGSGLSLFCRFFISAIRAAPPIIGNPAFGIIGRLGASGFGAGAGSAGSSSSLSSLGFSFWFSAGSAGAGVGGD